MEASPAGSRAFRLALVALAGGLVLALCGVLYFPRLGTPFANKGEPREALSFLEQSRTGDWILPLTNGVLVPSKPPLLRWTSGAVAAASGRVDEWSARLPSALFATVAVLAVFAVGVAAYGTAGGAVAGVALATSWLWFLSARQARTDMALTACLTVALLALWRVCRRPAPGRLALLVLYVAAALAVLAKGPIGVALPALVGLVYLAMRWDLGRLGAMRLPWGAIVVLLVAGSWYVLAAVHGGEPFVERQILKENLFRFLEGRHHVGHRHPWHYYLRAFPIAFLPWTLLLPAVAIDCWRSRRRLDERGLLFPLVWLLVVIGFYSLSAGKRAVYVLPAHPAAALLVGALFDPRGDGRSALARTAPLLYAVAAAVVVVLLGAGAALLAGAAGFDPLAALAPWLEPAERVALPVVRNLAAARAGALAALLAVVLGLVAASALAAARERFGLAVAAVAGAFACIAAVSAFVVEPAVAARRTLAPFAAAVGARVAPRDEIRFAGPIDYGTLFYLGRHAPSAARPIWEAAQPGACRYLLVWKSRWRTLRPEARAMLVPVAKSDGTGPKGDDRLLLVRARSEACQRAAAGAGSVASRRAASSRSAAGAQAISAS